MKPKTPATLKELCSRYHDFVAKAYWGDQYRAVNEAELHDEAVLEALWEGLAEAWDISRTDLEQIYTDVHSIKSGFWSFRGASRSYTRAV